MSHNCSQNKVVIIVGPTAVGKTRLAIDLASRISGEIVSADSRYIYKGLNIGSAKPDMKERRGIPHHMIDIADPNEVWSLAKYLKATNNVIGETIARRHCPIVVGGTGQYIRALTEGWSIPALEPNYELRRILNEWAAEIGQRELHQKLGVLDREACDFIDPSNVRRTTRALEVIFTTGKKFSEQRTKKPSKYDFWIVGLERPRSELYELVDERIENMFQEGLISEVQSLLEQGYGPNLPSLSAIGYREVSQYLDQKITLEEAKTQMRRNTRNFIRRQNNWFKKDDPSIHWYMMDPDPIEKIVNELQHKFLASVKSNDK